MKPSQAAEILTTHFLERELRKTKLLGDASIEDVQIVGPFESSTATVYQLLLTYQSGSNTANLPRSVFAKIFQGTAFFTHGQTELRFLQELAPKLEGDLTPRLLAAVETSPETLLLLLEDLTASGFTKDHTVLKEQSLGLLADGLARLHARWWDSELVRKGSFTEPRAIATRVHIASLDAIRANTSYVQNTITDFYRANKSEMTDDEGHALKRLSAKWSTLFNRRVTLGRGLTLIHGDFHLLGNVFYSEEAHKIKIIDWTETKVGLGPHDLAYSLLSLEGSQRMQRDTPLVQRYHARLGEHGINDYSWEQLLFDYRFALLTNLLQSAAQKNLRWYHKTFEVVQEWEAESLLFPT